MSQPHQNLSKMFFWIVSSLWVMSEANAPRIEETSKASTQYYEVFFPPKDKCLPRIINNSQYELYIIFQNRIDWYIQQLQATFTVLVINPNVWAIFGRCCLRYHNKLFYINCNDTHATHKAGMPIANLFGMRETSSILV